MADGSRVLGIDIARGLGIAAVVLGHNWIVLHEKGELFRVIYSFHLPLFFFLSGVFLESSVEWKGFLLTKANSLLKPCFSVLLFALFLKYALSALKGDVRIFEWIDVVKILYGTASVIPWAPLWFLPHLFLASVFSLWVIKSAQGKPVFYLQIFAFFMLLLGVFFIKWFADLSPGFFGFSSMGKVGLPWSLDLIFVSSSFIVSGYILRRRVVRFDLNVPALIFSVIFFFCLNSWFDDVIDFNSRIYDGFLVSTLEAFCGIYIILSVASLLSRNHLVAIILSRLGAGSIFILLFHGIVQNVSFGFLSSLNANLHVAGILSFVVALIGPVFLLSLVNKNKALSFILLGSKKIS